MDVLAEGVLGRTPMKVEINCHIAYFCQTVGYSLNVRPLEILISPLRYRQLLEPTRLQD